MQRLVRIAAACVAASCVAYVAPLHALEPPPDQDGEDFVVERADSLADGDLEVGVGVAGSNAGYRRSRHVRFHGDSLDASLREGDGDEITGSDLEGALFGGRFGVGRVAPRWGRGLALGEPVEPWSRRPRATPYRRKPRDDLAWYRAPIGRARAGAMIGRLDKVPHAGFELGWDALRFGLAGGHEGVRRGSLWWGEHHRGVEMAWDRRGRWRAEAAAGRDLGRGRATAMVRSGSTDYRPIGDPRRTGPARAFALSVEDSPGAGANPRWGGHVSLWRFRPGLGGARLVLETEHRWSDALVVAAGWEEHHGTRRDPRLGGSLAQRAWSESAERRQGAWTEWRTRRAEMDLAIRLEAWGERSFARDRVRSVSTVQFESPPWMGARIRVTHSVFRVERGEHVYLPEASPDRLTFRALTGRGERTRVELSAPFASGNVHAALHHTRRTTGDSPVQWTLDWTRRSRRR